MEENTMELVESDRHDYLVGKSCDICESIINGNLISRVTMDFYGNGNYVDFRVCIFPSELDDADDELVNYTLDELSIDVFHAHMKWKYVSYSNIVFKRLKNKNRKKNGIEFTFTAEHIGKE